MEALGSGGEPKRQSLDIRCTQTMYLMLRAFGQFAEHCHQSLPHARIMSHLLPVLGRWLRSARTLFSRARARGRDTNESLQNCVCLPLARKTPHGPSLRTSCPTACYISLSTLFVSRFRPQNNGHQHASNFAFQGSSVLLGCGLPAPFLRLRAASPPRLLTCSLPPYGPRHKQTPQYLKSCGGTRGNEGVSRRACVTLAMLLHSLCYHTS